ncbi:FcoT family thioesterase [Streptomyces sp. NPDC001508]|uniref:FcoT family thioesterase n=1 Tax=Streptomyces sp. NPDC001508 TaxID=3154656 RepID=UPI0033326690
MGSLLITDFKSAFRRPISSSSFHGELTFTRVVERLDLAIVQIGARFWDAVGGRSAGELAVAVVDAPKQGAR